MLSGPDRQNRMPGEGFEPPTFGLQNRCTTTVLTRRKYLLGMGLYFAFRMFVNLQAIPWRIAGSTRDNETPVSVTVTQPS